MFVNNRDRRPVSEVAIGVLDVYLRFSVLMVWFEVGESIFAAGVVEVDRRFEMVVKKINNLQ